MTENNHIEETNLPKNREDLINKILEDKNVVNYTEEEIKYCTTPIGNAIYNHRGRKRKEKKCLPTDRVKCEMCGKEYTRSGKYNHDKTKVHQTYVKLNKKIASVLLSS